MRIFDDVEWFDRVGYNVHIAVLENKYGIKPTSLDEWVSMVGLKAIEAA